MAVGIRRQWRAFSGDKLLPVPEPIPRRCHRCDEPVGPESYTWCTRHDAERIARLDEQFAALSSAFKEANR